MSLDPTLSYLESEVEAMKLFVNFVRGKGYQIDNWVLLVKIWEAYRDAYDEIGSG